MRALAILLASLSINEVSGCLPERELVFVQAMFRHGDRAPSEKPYPNDENDVDKWEGGWSSLTKIGKQQAEDLGLFFRLRYPLLTGTQYNEAEVFMLASKRTRTQLSAEFFFRGLYPNKVPPQVLTSENCPDEMKMLVLPTLCGFCKELYKRDFAKTVKEMDKRYADVYKFLQPLTGIKKFNTKSMSGIYSITREWVHKRWPQHGNRTTLDIVIEIHTLDWMALYGSFEKGKGHGGFPLYKWIEDSTKVSKGERMEKLKLYSTHDFQVTSLMYTMGIGNGLLVPYVATVIWELYKNGENYEVDVYYRNETFTDNVYPMKIPGCGSPCILEKLSQLYKNATFSTIEERKEYCKKKKSDVPSEGSESTRIRLTSHQQTTTSISQITTPPSAEPQKLFGSTALFVVLILMHI